MTRFPAAVAELDEPAPLSDGAFRRVAMRSGSTTFIVDPAAVERLESAGAYVRVHERERSFLLRGSLEAVMRRLSPRRLVRVHRSVAVAVDAIVEIRRLRAGDLRVVLASGTVVAATRISREALERLVSLH